MLINLLSSKLFTVEPAKRFAKEFNVPEAVWIRCWLKYRVLDLSTQELCDYIHITTGRKPSKDSVKRWVARTVLYERAREAFKMGASNVTSEFFTDYKDYVESELLRNLKSSARHIPKSIV